MNRKNNIIAIASGKGGVGKTWLSISLSHALSKAGKKILLFDGDLGLANIDVQLGLMPAHDIGAVVEGKLTLKQVIQRYDDGGFDVIAGRSGALGLASIPAEKLQNLLNDLKALAESYDYLLLDLGAGVDRTVRWLAGIAGINLVVVTDEPTSLTDAYAYVKLGYKAGETEDFRIVVNMASSMAEGDKTWQALDKACRNFLKFSPQLAAIIRRDSKVKESIRNQSSLLTRYPSSEAAQDVEKLAGKIISGGQA